MSRARRNWNRKWLRPISEAISPSGKLFLQVRTLAEVVIRGNPAAFRMAAIRYSSSNLRVDFYEKDVYARAPNNCETAYTVRNKRANRKSIKRTIVRTGRDNTEKTTTIRKKIRNGKETWNESVWRQSVRRHSWTDRVGTSKRKDSANPAESRGNRRKTNRSANNKNLHGNTPGVDEQQRRNRHYTVISDDFNIITKNGKKILDISIYYIRITLKYIAVWGGGPPDALDPLQSSPRKSTANNKNNCWFFRLHHGGRAVRIKMSYADDDSKTDPGATALDAWRKKKKNVVPPRPWNIIKRALP